MLFNISKYQNAFERCLLKEQNLKEMLTISFQDLRYFKALNASFLSYFRQEGVINRSGKSSRTYLVDSKQGFKDTDKQ